MTTTTKTPDKRESNQQLAARVPPHSVEAEQSVLGGLLLDNLAWDRAADLIGEADFYRHEHRLIFAAIAGLVQHSRPADVITVFESLQSLGKAEDSGGLAYLNDLAHSVPNAANIRRYAEIVRERSILRKLIAASDQIATAAFNLEGREPGLILDQAESAILAVGAERARQGQSASVQVLTVALLDRLNELAENPGESGGGVRSGFYDLDRMTGGLQRGDLVVLAARPSMGKTALALNIAEHVCVKDELPVLIFSMEMSGAQLTKRLLSSIGRIPSRHLDAATLDQGEWGRLAEAVESVNRGALEIDWTSSLSTAELRARARRVARQYGGTLGLVVVDYLQLMSGAGGRTENRATELAEISRGLKALAKELDCPVLALSQLNRESEKRTDKRPMLSDLRESGAIEQDADIVMLIHRDEYYTKEASKEPGVAELIIAKQRNGPVGTIKLAFLKPLTKFENLAP